MSWFKKSCEHQWVEYVRAEHPPATRSGDCIYLNNDHMRLAFIAGQISILFRCTLCTATRTESVVGKLKEPPT